MTEFVRDVSAQNFEQEVLTASFKVPVLVDFWAPWCAPCRSLGPVLEKLAAEYEGQFILAKVNSDQNQELAVRYAVRGIPNVKAFVHGQLASEFTGSLPESSVRAFIDGILPSPAEPLRQEALAARAGGDTQSARALLARALEIDPLNEAARLDMIELMVDDGDVSQAEELLRDIEESARDAPRVHALRARVTLAAATGDSDPKALQGRIDTNPDDLEARFELANLMALKEDYRPAMEQSIEIVRRSREFRDDAGRKTLITLFNLLGSDNELVREYRRELAALLNR